MKFGALLKNRRKELNLTLKEISTRVGVAEPTVQRWESGNIKMIKGDKLNKLADVLQISLQELTEWLNYRPAAKENLEREDNKLNPNGKLATEAAEFEEFITFLESIGYIVKIFAVGEEGESFIAEVIKDDKKTEFSKLEFENFKLETKKTVDYQIWQKSQGNI